jgi:hypothetical protein
MFYGCTGLTHNSFIFEGQSIFKEFPPFITSIGPYALYDCSGLTQLTIPSNSGLTFNSIDVTAFGNSGLTDVMISSTLASTLLGTDISYSEVTTNNGFSIGLTNQDFFGATVDLWEPL